jgi:hypothetical protein
MTFAEALAELMAKYDTARAAWIAAFGDDRGFDQWFTIQVRAPA